MEVCAEAKATLAERRTVLDQVALLNIIREAQSALVVIVSRELRPTPRGESLEQFLAKMPDRWREIERLFRRLKGFRRIFSRFEKLNALFLGFIPFALIIDSLL